MAATTFSAIARVPHRSLKTIPTRVITTIVLLLLILSLKDRWRSSPKYLNVSPLLVASGARKNMPVKGKQKNTTKSPLVTTRPTESVFKTVYLIRHGQSKAQAAKKDGLDRKRDNSLRDCGLSPTGRHQALAIPSHLTRYNHQSLSPETTGIELVISSPLTRALETAVLGFHSRTSKNQVVKPPPILVHYELREIGSPIPENTPRDSMDQTLQYIADRNINEAIKIGSSDDGVTKIDTTTLQPVNWPHHHKDDMSSAHNHNKQERIHEIFQWIATERPEHCIAVVCHYGVIRAALASTHPELRPKNGVPIRCQLHPDGSLRVCNEA